MKGKNGLDSWFETSSTFESMFVLFVVILLIKSKQKKKTKQKKTWRRKRLFAFSFLIFDFFGSLSFIYFLISFKKNLLIHFLQISCISLSLF